MLESQLASRMEQLQATVQSKTAVPTAQVYPQFIHLAQIWSGFQDEMVLLSVLSNILVTLEPYTRVRMDNPYNSVCTNILVNLKFKVQIQIQIQNRPFPSESVEYLFLSRGYTRLIYGSLYIVGCIWRLVTWLKINHITFVCKQVVCNPRLNVDHTLCLILVSISG